MSNNEEGRYTDPLSINVKDDLARVDKVMTKIIKDRDTWNEFIRDPNGVFVKFGLLPSTSPENSDRINRIFYACLANKELMSLMFELYEEFSSPHGERNESHYLEGLRKGVIQNLVEYDLSGLHFLIENPDKLKRIYELSLHDLNEKEIFSKKYETSEIDEYIGASVQTVKDRVHPAEFPVLPGGAGEPEEYNIVGCSVGPVVVAIVAVEAGGAVTVEVAGAALKTNINKLLEGAYTGDKESVENLAMIGKMLDFSAELAVHIENFERNK